MTARRARPVFEPLADRPYPDAIRERSPFAAPWSKTRDALLREADHLSASVFVIEVDCSRRHLRADGELRADARLHSGRIRVSMDTRHGPLRYRKAARKLHPDAGGSPEQWERPDAARQLMETGGLL